jgi:hypothetical protein
MTGAVFNEPPASGVIPRLPFLLPPPRRRGLPRDLLATLGAEALGSGLASEARAHVRDLFAALWREFLRPEPG